MQASMIVLAGGKSSRMGRDKAELPLLGRRFLDISLEKAGALGLTDIVVSGYRGKPEPIPNVRWIADKAPDQGPLGGLETCLEEIRSEWALVLSVDAPLVPVEELKKLLSLAKTSAHPAVIAQSGEKQYPLIGVYHRSLAPAMAEEIAQRKGSVFALLRRVGYDVYKSSAPEALFANVNDPERYAQLQKEVTAWI